MQLSAIGAPTVNPKRPWPFVSDIDALILERLMPTDLLRLRLASKAFNIIVNAFQLLKESQTKKLEQFKHYTSLQISILEKRKILSRPVRIRETEKAFFKKSGRNDIRQIGLMIRLYGREEGQRLITWEGKVFRDLSNDEVILSCSFFRALIFRSKLNRYEVLDEHYQTRIKLPDNIEPAKPYVGLLHNQGESVALVCSVNKRRIVLWGNAENLEPLADLEIDETAKLNAYRERLIVINRTFVTFINKDKTFKTWTYPDEVSYVQVDFERFIVVTRNHLYIESYEGQRLRVINKANQDIKCLSAALVRFNNNKLIVTHLNKQVNNIFESTNLDSAFNRFAPGDISIYCMREIDENLLGVVAENNVILQQCPFLYNIQTNQLTQVCAAQYGAFFWYPNSLVAVSLNGTCSKID
jgi:hypothetical protein